MKRGIVLVWTSLLCLLTMGCGAMVKKEPTPTPIPLSITQRRSTYSVEQLDIVDVFSVRGQIVPSRQQELYFKSTGRISRVRAQKGDAVKKGDLLAELEMEDLLKQVQQAAIDLETAEAKLASDEKANRYAIERAQHQVNMQQIQVDVVRASLRDDENKLKAAEIDLQKAKVALDRAQAAYDKIAWQPGAAALPQAVALQQADLDYKAAQTRYEQAKNAVPTRQLQLKLAEESLALAKLSLQEVSEGISVFQKQAVERAKIALDRLNAQVDERRIYAPFDGILLSGSIKPGNMQEAFQVVFIIGDPSELVIAVPKTADLRLERVKEDMDITFTSYRHPDEPVKATLLTRFYPIESLKDEGKQTDNAYFAMEKVWPDLEPGDQVEIRIVLDKHEGVLAVPPEVVRRFLGRAFVVVQEGDLQKRVDVRIGLSTTDWIEVQGDLKVGDLVVAP